jgi:hypothetical protein
MNRESRRQYARHAPDIAALTHRPFQLRKPEQLSAEQIEQDHQLPAAFENLQRPIDAAGGRCRRVLLDLTLG